MKIRILLTALFLIVSACATPPPVSGTFATKEGKVTLEPGGRIIVVVEPRTSK